MYLLEEQNFNYFIQQNKVLLLIPVQNKPFFDGNTEKRRLSSLP